MRAKEYLIRVWNIDKDIQSRINERQGILLTQISGIDYSKENVQETQKVFDDKYLKYLELREEIDKKIDNLIELKRTISCQIDELDDKISTIILRERYINMREWEEIKQFLGYEDVSNIHRLHGKALNQFNEYLSLNVMDCHMEQ